MLVDRDTLIGKSKTVAGCEGVSVEPWRQSLDTPLLDVPWYRSCRVLLAFITAWGYVFFYLLRINLSLAIVCMVRDPDAAVAGGYDNASSNDNQSMPSVRPSFSSTLDTLL